MTYKHANLKMHYFVKKENQKELFTVFSTSKVFKALDPVKFHL